MSRTTRGEAFAGLSVAITTPFKDGEVDFPKLKEQIDFQVAAGTICICPAGTTGESPTLTHEENDRVIAASVEYAAGRIKVMAGTGSNSTAEALRLTKQAEKNGADGALVVAPYYNKPTQEGFYQHYKALAEAVSIPICVYNIPGRTGKNIEPETIARIAECKNVTMVKEATGSLDQASQVAALTDLTILSGDDSLTLPMLAIGGRGVISVVGNIVPQAMVALLKAWEAGDIATAQAAHRKLFPLCRDMLGLSTNPIPVKAAMKLLGRDTGDLRMPMTPLDPASEQKLRQTLIQFGLL
jgi:4-hydroxy-tetrahydrodipicolinate synthase